ncbi:histidine--tRNA ligase [Desulfosporosinus sp. BICA1-9]|uniref:histidine--tRNA ligase n=1 Tax=Desulfosporosinus sp. BICA1-9 TaxID=1531958 RepID=UPI00054C4866|nr:histidine--tRNA ligase [Desulfosporosinus sp. BICA1-9]KJS48525.1 MAG: histidyl-tRNA synthetase [Peptococcaceae bacterium BRH_c23]KJS77942.1 MAG: histidyl-tRNA synthetase [Desulfosporosinus sp. BICA1-9]HBW33912.1 histidine--tRNA ligase [Desulfosporosinus sp.]
MAIQRPKGTQDLLPGTIEQWHYLEETIRSVCREFGYEEIRTPMFEATELFQRGVGQTTDIVKKEMYTFLDKGDRSMTLRPEMTASVCRAYVEDKLHGQPQPVKLYYMGPMFRYERPQSGRYRQFHQFGVEVLGADQPLVDAEVISLVWNLYKRLGLVGLEVHVNSVGCPTCRAEHRKQLQEFLDTRQNELCSDCQERFERNPLRILDCKNTSCQTLTTGAPTTKDTLCEECSTHFEGVLTLLSAAGVAYRVNPRLVRGLDYYTKTAFEVMVEEIGAQSAICGGGRYDKLVEEIGGSPTPGIGFAMGIERVLAALQVQNKLPQEKPKLFAMVIPLGEKAQNKAFSILCELRNQGIPVGMDLLSRGLKAQLKAADRQHVRYALMLGEAELEKNVLLVRDLTLGEQNEVPLASAVEEINKKYQRGV